MVLTPTPWFGMKCGCRRSGPPSVASSWSFSARLIDRMAGLTLENPSGQGSRVGACVSVWLSALSAPACVPSGTSSATDPLILAERDLRSDFNVELVGFLLSSLEMAAGMLLSVSVGVSPSSLEMVARLSSLSVVVVASSLRSLGVSVEHVVNVEI